MLDPSARWRLMLFASLLCVGIVGALPGAASALVGTSSAANVPYIELQGTGDNYARTSTIVGSKVYVGGHFSKVFEPVTTEDYERANLYAYDESTGFVTSFAPTINGEVWALEPSPDGHYLYVAGDFSTVNGAARKGLARFDLRTAALTKFDAHLDGRVRTVDYVGGHLIVGGAFTRVKGIRRAGLASLDPTTGVLQSYVNARLSGSVTSTAGPTQVLHSAVNSRMTQMAVAGNFTSADGATHWRALLLNLGPTSATVSAWNAPILKQPCNPAGTPNYVTGLSFSQDGTWFAMSANNLKNSTGPLTATICDAVARFSTTATSHAPTWANYTGCDSLFAVLVTPDAVYVGGHQRWLDNSNACNYAGTGAVSRPGVGAVDPATGKALSWNPTRSRGHGADFLQLTARGLLILSDCAAAGNSKDASSGANYLAGDYHPCVGLLPAASPIMQTLSVSKAGHGTGTVTSSPAGISCGSTCSSSYKQGSSVILTAKPDQGFSFTGWSGACTGVATCAVSMVTTRSVSAHFEKNCVVPKVKGKTLKVAKRRIKARDCRVGKIKHAFSAKVKKGRVIAQKPKARRVLAHGARVRMTVSRGKKR